MMRFSPTIKVSMGLVLVTISVLLLGDLIGVVPSEERGRLDGRKILSESLAIQFSVSVTGGDARLIVKTLDALVEREGDVLSAALRSSNGRILAQAGDHAHHWRNLPLDKSTPTHVQVPVFQGQKRWGTVEIVFAPLSGAGGFMAAHPLVVLLLYFALAGFSAYWIFIKRTLRELDPRAVIPERVKAAFNALAEGLVIMDEKGHIILANTSFARKIDFPADELMGQKVSQFNWVKGNRKNDGEQSLPWVVTLNEQRQQTGVALRYETRRSGTRTFMVNTSPITDAKGAIRGVLATFDDLTDLEEKQVELKQTISQLECSREELREKAVELEYLATRDPLTGCLNRRAFFERCEQLLDEAKRKDTRLSCIMTDIDHFKSINDRHGHAAGDKVIQMVANELRANGRPDDIVGRYGGEEFCIALPGLGAQEAVAVAERLRAAVKNAKYVQSSTPLRITSSFGVAELADDVSNPEALIDRADQALYIAKENGRNRVIGWHKELVANQAGGLRLTPTRYAEIEDDRDRAPVRDDVASPLVDPQDELSSLRCRVDELEQELTHSQRALTEQAGRDVLTDLPNRLLFFDRISQALNRGQRFDQIAAVLVLEIDMFQRINEALGAVVGDQLLRKVAQRLTQILRSTDTISFLGNDMPDVTVSRTGADEFGILLTDMHDVEMVTWIVKRILDSMAKSMTIDGHEIFITCNAGISLYPHDADTASALLEHASAARFKAKQRLGKNNLQFYSADINQESFRQLWFESQLHHALRLGELSLNYQPKIDLATGRITSMEALIRWNNPKLGQVPPGEFIPIAERTGLINEIGEWVIRSACGQARRWREAGFRDVGVAVNLSALQFRQKNLCENIAAILDGSELEPGLLELEITESAVMDNFDGALEMIRELHKAGVQFAIDDFGTGYSSLAYLKHLPVNTLKIDRSFLSDTVPDKQDSLIITAIVAMAHSLNLRVVAEGVETGAQKRFLEHLECDEIQGYLISKPVPEDDALELLRRHNSPTRCARPQERVG